MDRPNILLIQSDQHRADCVGANGHPLIRTPHMDRLAAEGANFTHAFCPIPLCTPARCSLLTGVWPTQHGTITNAGTEGFRPMAPGTPTYSALLAEASYWLAHVGKWQVAPGTTPRDFGFHDSAGQESHYPAWRRRQNLPDRPRRNGWFGEADPSITPAQSHLAWAADAAIRLLRRAAERHRPFLLQWDPPEPHLPNVVPEPHASMYPPDRVEAWPGFADDLAGKPYVQAQQRRTWGVDDWTWADWAPVVGRYLGEVTLLDEQLGRVLAALDEMKLADNTLVVYTADHGDMCGSHGMVDKHFVMYDDVVRVPLLIRWPGRIPRAARCDAFVCGALDLARTFCEAAGVDVPPSFAGRDLVAAVNGDGEPPRQDVFATYHGNQFGLYSQRMVRNRRWKYVWNAAAEDELYDLQTDPGELHNLARRPTGAEPLASLRRRLVDWMAQTRDPLLNAWTRAQLLDGLSW